MIVSRRDRGLAGLAVADDQLALAAADRDHRVDGLEAGLHRHSLDRNIQTVADAAKCARNRVLVFDHQHQGLTGRLPRTATVVLRRNTATKRLVHVGHCAPANEQIGIPTNTISVPRPVITLKRRNG